MVSLLGWPDYTFTDMGSDVLEIAYRHSHCSDQSGIAVYFDHEGKITAGVLHDGMHATISFHHEDPKRVAASMAVFGPVVEAIRAAHSEDQNTRVLRETC